MENLQISGRDKTVLVFGAHPDDVEFGCGATMARLKADGARLVFVICTLGNRGSRHHKLTHTELVSSRKAEQEIAAKIIGGEKVIYLDHEDGNLIADISFKEEVVRLIRTYKPDMIFTHDPAWFYRTEGAGAEVGFGFVNHTDHRATGTAVLDAVYPLSRDLLSFPHHIDEGLETHKVEEVYFFNFDTPNVRIDVTNFIDKKLESIFAHKSQIDDPAKTEEWVRDRLSNIGKPEGLKYAEGFVLLRLR